jgi:dolichyl-phosphate-mannose--protein O-mannosyl transferase
MLMIPLMYFLGKKLFGTWIGGFSAAFLLTFDFMHFTMARMATSDTYVVFFSLASQLFFLIYLQHVMAKGWKTSILPLFLAVLFFSFSFSTKWFALFAFMGELVLLAVIRINDVRQLKTAVLQKVTGFFKYPFLYLLGFLGVAVLVYCLAYVPDLLAGDSPQTIFDLQFTMYQFHSGLTDPHSFQSPWFSWPLLFNPCSSTTHVPLLLSTSNLPSGMLSEIVLLGNPLVWWVGFACILGLAAFFVSKILLSIAKKRRIELPLSIVFVLVFFFFSWVPYILISRVTFIYHFYLAVPMLILAVTYFINKMWTFKWGKLLTVIFFVAVVGLFVLFYPALSGAPTTSQTLDSLKWFGSWVI